MIPAVAMALPGWLPLWARDPRLGVAAAGLCAAAAVAAAIWLLRRLRRPSASEIECARRLHVHAIGRVTGGEILEMLPAPGAEGLAPTLVYQYEVGGVTYQVSQALHLVPIEMDPQSWIPGWPVQVKFDPANPGNSIIACEHWRGLAVRPRTRAAGAPASSPLR